MIQQVQTGVNRARFWEERAGSRVPAGPQEERTHLLCLAYFGQESQGVGEIIPDGEARGFSRYLIDIPQRAVIVIIGWAGDY